MFDKTKALRHINSLLKKNKIQATFSKNGQAGYAYYYNRNEVPKIKIPTPNSVEQFGVAIHEIGHIVLGHCEKHGKYLKDSRPNYVQEYEAEQFAIEGLQEKGLDTTKYELRAKRYILENVAQATNRRHPITKVPQEIIDWLEIDTNKWGNAKKVFVPRGKYNDLKEVHKSIKYIKDGN